MPMPCFSLFEQALSLKPIDIGGEGPMHTLDGTTNPPVVLPFYNAQDIGLKPVQNSNGPTFKEVAALLLFECV